MGGALVTAHVRATGAPTRCGLVAGRGLGPAVARNRARRLLREAWKGLVHRVRPGFDVVLVARPAIGTAKMQDVRADVADVLAGMGVLEP